MIYFSSSIWLGKKSQFLFISWFYVDGSLPTEWLALQGQRPVCVPGLGGGGIVVTQVLGWQAGLVLESGFEVQGSMVSASRTHPTDPP